MGVTTRPPRVGFLVSYGPENFLLDREIARARSWPKRDCSLVDGEDINELELISRIEAASYEGPRTLILDNAQDVKLSKAMKGFLEERSKTDTSTVLLAVVRSDKLPAGWAQVAEKGELSEAKKFKPWQTDNILRWLDDEASSHDVKLGPDVGAMLLKWVDIDLYRLANEIRKLAIYVGPKGTVTKEHLGLVVSKTPGATHFQVAEHTIAKKAAVAINTFSILFKNEGSECLVPTTNAIMKQVERALIVRRSLDKGVDADLVAASVGLDAKKFPYKQLADAARKHTSSELVRHMSRLCKLDVDVKGAASSKRTLVELAVLAIAR
jgi:DNA polymerase III delta subunit